MGGGPSLPAGILKAPADAIYVSANDHGLRLLKDNPQLDRQASYVVALDKIEKRARFDVGPRRDGQPWGLPVVSRHMFADFRFPLRFIQLSGIGAAWLLRFMGCSPIVLVGMDCYGGPSYHDRPQEKTNGKTVSERDHVGRWSRAMKQYPAQYRCIGGSRALAARCGEYDPGERREDPPSRAQLLVDMQTGWVRFAQEFQYKTRPFPPGIYEMPNGEVEHLVRMRRAVRAQQGEIERCLTSLAGASPSPAPAVLSVPSCAGGSSPMALTASS